MKDVFHISQLIIKRKLNILTNLEKEELERLKQKYPFSSDVKIEDLINKNSLNSAINKEKAWEAIEVKSKLAQRRPKRVFKLLYRSWHKYAAAAVVVGILATTYFFKDNLFITSVEKEVSPTIVNTNTIEPGTDKAVLTLEDGSQISLEKGNNLQTNNAISNGEEIVYKNSDSELVELVYNHLTVPRGGQFVIELSDGTKVWLNSESQLKYPVNFIEGQAREVELVYGEAYFDVSPSSEHNGAKFKVLNKVQEVEVLGTEFNIKAYKNETNVYTTLVEGKVAVNFESTQQYLKPNQQSNLNVKTKNIMVSDVDVYDEISWKEGVFSFDRKPLYEIVKVLSRWYDVEIIFKNTNLKTVKFNGILEKNQSIEEILSIMKSTSINNYVITDKTIILE
ncbi:FecR family protein [Aestuariivivens sediminis]|uniref:FecR family protein n=1 Tax=Aestuariivivens sediminis TaxID=2913557 RepID=UPI001F583B35|nr:FecR family protein [Aestuariivivens sediminis]